MSDEVKQKRAAKAWLYLSILFAFMIGGFFTWLYWPWPEITIAGPATVINSGSGPEGSFRTGDVIIWQTAEVCQPSGHTDAQIWAVRDFFMEDGEVVVFRTKMAERDFDVPVAPEGGCVKDNPTTVYVDGNLPTGVYRFEVEACVSNPTPANKCGVFAGPSNVSITRDIGNPPVIAPTPEGTS